MTFTEQQRNWEALAKADPMWAVLSEPQKRGGKWDLAEFYVSGREEVEEVLDQLALLDLALGPDLLDLGCGPGRVAHAFAGYFDQVTGYDISERMLELAREAAAEDNETFVLNETDDLSPFTDENFDLVYCSRMLQRVDPERIESYLDEMVRVLAPGGILWLGMLSHPTGWEGTRESGPDPAWAENGETPHYTVASAGIDWMTGQFMDRKLILHQARLVGRGEGQSIFSYDYVVQKRP